MITRSRCLLVWLSLTAVTAAVARWSWASVQPADRFDQLVASAAGLALAGCAAWAWVVGTVVVAQALRRPGHAPRPTRGVPAWASRAVLAACGLAVVTVGPAQASYDGGWGDLAPQRAQQAAAPGTIDGLPFPDRAVGPARAAPSRTSAAATPPRAQAAGAVVVAPRDSLWTIAAGLLGPTASDADIAATTDALHDLNRAVIGTDPDLIQPGVRLRTPGS